MLFLKSLDSQGRSTGNGYCVTDPIVAAALRTSFRRMVDWNEWLGFDHAAAVTYARRDMARFFRSARAHRATWLELQ